MQIAIPYMQLRGGSSKGLFFKASDLPADEAERNKIIIAAMEGVGHGDPRQIDGLGGATPLTSKVAYKPIRKKRGRSGLSFFTSGCWKRTSIRYSELR